MLSKDLVSTLANQMLFIARYGVIPCSDETTSWLSIAQLVEIENHVYYYRGPNAPSPGLPIETASLTVSIDGNKYFFCLDGSMGSLVCKFTPPEFPCLWTKVIYPLLLSSDPDFDKSELYITKVVSEQLTAWLATLGLCVTD